MSYSSKMSTIGRCLTEKAKTKPDLHVRLLQFLEIECSSTTYSYILLVIVLQPRSQGLSSYRLGLGKMRDPGNEVDRSDRVRYTVCNC